MYKWLKDTRKYIFLNVSLQDDCCPNSSFQTASVKMNQACCENTNTQTSVQRSLQKPAASIRGDAEAVEIDGAGGSDSPQTCETCKCKKTSSRTCDAATQTSTESTETSDASTQCGVTWSAPPVDGPAQRAATGGQCDTASAAQPNTHGTGSAGDGHTPWSRRRPSRVVNKAKKSDGDSVTQRRSNPSHDAPTETKSRGRTLKQDLC